VRAIAYTLFDTAIGRCGIAWNDRGISCVQLPGSSDGLTRLSLERRAGRASESDPPEPVRRAIAAIAALLAGERRELIDLTLDTDGIPEFNRRVYDVARAIPPGSTLSYGEVAERLGAPGAARAVGQALGENPWPIIVPCHRVLAADGGIGGFSAPGGTATKRRLLALEGVGQPRLF
jgi:methylated-DNA-[protein]-cysteine S-methyltransferase